MGAVVLAAAVTSAPALAQAGGQAARPTILPPTIRETGRPPIIRMYLITALIGGLVIGANLIPSKRGHQD